MSLPFFPQPKPGSRLQAKQAEKQLTVVTERTFKQEIWQRDKAKCRMCKRKVIKSVARIAERGEVHHLHGRIGDLKFEAKCALLACCECHEKLTGRVAEKWIGIGTAFWRLHGERVIDARKPVIFKRVA